MKLSFTECPCDIFICDIIEDASLCRSEREERALRVLLDEAFGTEAERRHTCAGAPVLYIGGRRSVIGISVSHSRRHAVLAVVPPGLSAGVDVEAPRAQLATVAKRALSADEYDFFSSFDGGFLLAGTLKEALYKASRILLDSEPCFASQLRIPVGDDSLARAFDRDGNVVGSFSAVWCTLPDGERVTVVFTKRSQNLQ